MVHNTGNNVLSLAVDKSSCSCTSAELGLASLEPGASTQLLVRWRSSRVGRVVESVVLRTSDPRRPVLPLTIGAEVYEARLRAFPSRCFLRSDTGSCAVQRVMVVGPPGLVLTTACCEPPVAEVAMLERAEAEGCTTYGVLVRLPATAPVGAAKAILRIRALAEGIADLTMPVTVEVRGDLVANPRAVFVSEGEAGSGPSKTVTIQSRSGTEFRLCGVRCSDPRVQVGDVSPAPAVSHSLFITVKPGTQACVLAEVEVLTDVAGEDRIIVPVAAPPVPAK